VQEKINYYQVATNKIAAAIVADHSFRDFRNAIIQWVWPSDTAGYLLPKAPDEVADAGDWLLKSTDCLDWVYGEDECTLILTGPGSTISHLSNNSLRCSRGWQISSLVLPSQGVANR